MNWLSGHKIGGKKERTKGFRGAEPSLGDEALSQGMPCSANQSASSRWTHTGPVSGIGWTVTAV